MNRVYISGPMTGIEALNSPAFHAAAHALRGKGMKVVNPAEVCADKDMPWEQCMRADIRALCDCDALVLLPGWERSKGAHLELEIAHRLGMTIMLLADVLNTLPGTQSAPLPPARSQMMGGGVEVLTVSAGSPRPPAWASIE